MKIKVTMHIDKELHKKFKEYCQQNGYTISGRVSVLMKNELNEHG